MEALGSDRLSDEGEVGATNALAQNPSPNPGSVGEPEEARGSAHLSQVFVFYQPDPSLLWRLH